MPKRLSSPPDVRRLQPEEAQLLCRFCLRAQRSHWMETLDIADGQNWADSELGQLYAQLTGDQLFDNTDNDFLIVSNSWCHDCALQLRQAAKVAAQFRRANAFWSDYLNAWSPTGSTAAATEAVGAETAATSAKSATADQDLLANMKIEVEMIKTESADQPAISPEKDALAPNDDYDLDHLEVAKKQPDDEDEQPPAVSDDDFDRDGGGNSSEDEEYKPIATATPKPRKRGRPKGSRTTKSPAAKKTPAPAIKRESPQQLSADATTTAADGACKVEATAEEKKQQLAEAAPASKGQMCHICGGVYKWKMDRHMEAAHSELTCDICGRTFNHKVPLRRHFREDHGFQRYTCEICNRPGMTKSSWLRHQDMHRPKKERPYACDQCGNSYPTLHNLRQHVARVHVFKEVACEECGKTFVNVVRLRDHMIRHRPKTLTCPQPGCPRMFWLVKEQKEHCRTVHQKDRKYVCAVCGKAFLVNAQLKKHHSLGRCRGAAGSGAQGALGGGGGEHRQRGGRGSGGRAAPAQAAAEEMGQQQQQQQQQPPQTLTPLSSVELQQQQQQQHAHPQMQQQLAQPILHMLHHPHGQLPQQQQQQPQQQLHLQQHQLLVVGPSPPVATLATAATSSSSSGGTASNNSTSAATIAPQMMIFGPTGPFNPINVNMFSR